MRVLLTGGSGLLALNWAAAIRDEHSPVLGIHERQVELSGVPCVPLDLESVDNICQSIDACEARMVIHTAGLTNVDLCEQQPDLAYHINATLAGNVARACNRVNVPLVHISSDHLFSGTQRFVSEGAPVQPVNVYGRTKASAEQRVLDDCPDALVVRTNFFGWGTSYRKSFSDWIIASVSQERAITLFEDVFYTPIVVSELARAVHELIEAYEFGIVNVVGDERISKYEFGMKVIEAFRLRQGFVQCGWIDDRVDKVRRPHDMSLSNEKVCRLLGRSLGTVDEHLAMLRQHEQAGLKHELQAL